MKTKQTNMRFPLATLMQIKEIAEATEAASHTAVTVAAIAHFHDWLLGEAGPPTEIFLKMGVDGNYTVRPPKFFEVE